METRNAQKAGVSAARAAWLITFLFKAECEPRVLSKGLGASGTRLLPALRMSPSTNSSVGMAVNRCVVWKGMADGDVVPPDLKVMTGEVVGT